MFHALRTLELFHLNGTTLDGWHQTWWMMALASSHFAQLEGCLLGRHATSEASYSADRANALNCGFRLTPFSLPTSTTASMPFVLAASSCSNVLPVCFFHFEKRGRLLRAPPIWEVEHWKEGAWSL